VQSVAERPTDSLELWDFAVREKTEKSVKVELLVPQRVLRVRDVAKRAMIHEVKLHTPLFREDVGDDGPCAIMLEGDYTDVKAVWKNIYYHGAGQSTNGSTTAKEATYADVEPIAHRLRQDFAREYQQTFVEKECSLPDPFWQPIGRTGTIEYLQTQFGLQVNMLEGSGPLQYAILKGSERQIREVDKFLEGIRVQELERAHRKNSVDAVEKQVKIIRRNDLPSENLEAWQSVTRKQLERRTEIDFCLPERVWQESTRNGGAENLQARFAMEFEPMDVSQSGETRCITLKGDVVHADRAKSYFEGFQVTLPELQEDQEYLKLHAAATGLHMINDGNQRQSASGTQGTSDDSKRIEQTASGETPYRDSYKRLQLTPPLKSPTREVQVSEELLNAKIAIPEHIREEIETSNESTLQQIQKDSGLEAFVRITTADSQQCLKLVGTRNARREGKRLLQKSIDDDNERTGRCNPHVDKLSLPNSTLDRLPDHTHIVVLQMPRDMPLVKKHKRFEITAKTLARVRSNRDTDGGHIVKMWGTSASVKLAMAEVRAHMQEKLKEIGKPSANFEVLKMGSFADVGEVAPVRSPVEPAEPEAQTSILPEEPMPASRLKQHDASHSHFAWVKLSSTISRKKNRPKIRTMAEKHRSYIGAFTGLGEGKAVVRITGAKEAVNNIIDELQELSDEVLKDDGQPPEKVEILDMGLFKDMSDHEVFKESIRLGAAAKDENTGSVGIDRTAVASPQAPIVGRSHFAWLRVPLDRGAANKSTDVLAEIGSKTGCQISQIVPVNQTEGVIRVLGAEGAIDTAIEAIQELVTTETQKISATCAGKVEIVRKGRRTRDKGDRDFNAFALSLQSEAPMTPTEQRAQSPQQSPIEDGAAEQAERIASISANDKSTEGPTGDGLSNSKAKEAEGQPTQQTDQQLSDNMRSALRHVTQPVALVTSFMASAGSLKDADKRALSRGVTVSSLCTVTLHPKPVVSFNLRVPSRSWDAISASGFLRVHLLKASPEGATAAHVFTLPYEQSHEPFKHLTEKGGHMSYPRTRNPAKVPEIIWPEAIHANFVAKVLREKCIEVGDHMIIVAEVIKMSPSRNADATDKGALAYGMKGYRQLGGEIKPMELKLAEARPSAAMPAKEGEIIESVLDHVVKHTERVPVVDRATSDEKAIDEVETVANVADIVVKPAEQESTSSAVESHEEARDEVARNDEVDLYELFAADDDEFEATPAPALKNIEDLGPSSPMLDEESLRQVLEENEAAYSSLGLPSQIAANNPMLAQALNAVSGAYNDASAPDESSQAEVPQTHAPSVDRAADSTAPSESESKLQEQPSVEPSADPAVPSQPESASQTEVSPAEHASGSTTREDRPTNVLSSGKRPWGMDDTMTQQIRKMSIYRTSPSNRHHYSTNSNSDPNSPPISKKFLKTTVADYLCQIPTHRKRYTNLIKLQRSAEEFEAQLQRPNASMTEQEAASLSSQAQIARRKVSRELALRNAQDLRAMLDKGRVQATAVQWLETNLEHGQVVLLDDAKVLRRELEDGKLRVEEFEKAKAELTRDYEAIDAQLMRLRDFAEEDYGVDMDDDGDGFGNASEEEGRARGQ
jgi:flavin reductase (DIM6/NTAB) family NADH-FMN oxidoreductase RutF